MRPELSVCGDMNLLHPMAMGRFRALAKNLELAFQDKKTPTFFVPFETYRTPQRQQYLFEQKKTTRAKAFQSPHQYGLAVDFVPWVDGKWSWDNDHDWDFLAREAVAVKLHRPLKWDLAHIEDPRWNWIAGDLV